jgi:anti-sigma factor RsiW
MSACERIGPFLDAYHDGELGPLRRWTVRRHVGRCPECREDLAALGGIGAWVRDASAAETEPAPDVWSDIRWRLPARRPQPDPSRSPDRLRPGRAAFGMPALGAGVVAAAAALLVLVGPPELFGSAAGSVVRSLNTHGRPVMVLEGAPGDATIIWLMDDEGVRSAEDADSVWI